MFSQKSSTMRPFSAATVLAECGLTNTFGRSQSGLSGGSGSCSKTSSAAPRSLSRPASAVDQRRLVDDVAARDVDEDRGRLQEREPAGVEQMVRLARVRRREDERRRPRGAARRAARSARAARRRDPRRRPAAELAHGADHAARRARVREPRDLAADLAEPDDAHGLAARPPRRRGAPSGARAARGSSRSASLPNISIASRANSASGRACTPLAVVTATSELAQPDALREAADAGARRLDPAEARPRRERRRRAPAARSRRAPPPRRAARPSAPARRRSSTDGSGWSDAIARRREQLRLGRRRRAARHVARIALDELGLERRARDHEADVAHPRAAFRSGGSVKRPASEPPSTSSTAPEMWLGRVGAEEQHGLSRCRAARPRLAERDRARRARRAARRTRGRGTRRSSRARRCSRARRR